MSETDGSIPTAADPGAAAAAAKAKALLEQKRADIMAKVAAAKLQQQLAVAEQASSRPGAGKAVVSLDQLFSKDDGQVQQAVFEDAGPSEKVKAPKTIFRPHMQTGKFNKP